MKMELFKKIKLLNKPILGFFLMLFFAASCGNQPEAGKHEDTADGHIPTESTGKAASGKGQPLAKEAIIKIAEQYIAEQGYAHYKINIKKKPIIFEPGEFATDTNAIVKLRYNTLKPKAFGARQYGKDGQWAVGFEYVIDEPNIGRVVSVSKTGDKAFMQKDQLRLNWLYERD